MHHLIAVYFASLFLATLTFLGELPLNDAHHGLGVLDNGQHRAKDFVNVQLPLMRQLDAVWLQ